MNADAFNPMALLADRGYDSDAIRSDGETRDGVLIIPTEK